MLSRGFGYARRGRHQTAEDLRQEPIPNLQQERKVRQKATGNVTSESLGVWDLDLLAEEGGQVVRLLLRE